MATFSLQIVSDLHVEMMANTATIHQELVPRCDAIALCGDIGKPGSKSYNELIAHCSEKFRHVFVVLGNHEYYKDKMSDVESRFAKLHSQFPNVYPLNRTELRVDIGDRRLRILGCTLWSHIPDNAMVAVTTLLNDYKLIYRTHIGSGDDRTTRITFEDTNEFHRRDRDWLQAKFNEDTATPTIVLTHYAPSMVGTSDPAFEGKLTNHGFATNLSSMFQPNIRLWAFGHTHYQCDYLHQGTRIVTNARGYTTKERVGYQPDKVYTLPTDTVTDSAAAERHHDEHQTSDKSI